MLVQKSWILFILVLSVTALVNAGVPKRTPKQAPKDERIVGGFTTTIANEPYIVQLLFDLNVQCGGSILAPKWILTAAHCIYDNDKQPARFQVRAGATYLDRHEGVVRKVAKIIRRQDYNPKTYNNDIALLKLVEPLPLNGKTIKAISLASAAVPKGSTVKVSGWGLTTEDGNISNQLRSVYLSAMALDTCKRTYAKNGQKVTDMMMCAIGQGKDACSGDSGGPLVFNGKLNGVVSWGVGCARSDSPGVYADVMKFKSYISTVMQNN